MNRIIAPLGLVLLVLTLFGAVGCSAEAPAPQAPPPAIEPQTTDTQRVTAAEMAQQLAKERRHNAIKAFNEAFTAKDDWEAAVTGSDGSALCSLRQQYHDLDRAMGYIEGRFHDLKLEWSDVNVSQDRAAQKYREVAAGYAKELNRVLGLSYETRKKMGSCGSGEGSMAATDTGQMTRNLIDSLKSANASPTYIGMKSGEIRSRLLADYVYQIERARAELKRNNDSAGPYGLIREAMYDWHFTQDQLGVTDAELEGLKVP